MLQPIHYKRSRSMDQRSTLQQKRCKSVTYTLTDFKFDLVIKAENDWRDAKRPLSCSALQFYLR